MYLFLCLCVFMCTCFYVLVHEFSVHHECAGALRGQKKVSKLPELKLWAVASLLLWLLETKLVSYAGAASTLNCHPPRQSQVTYLYRI